MLPVKRALNQILKSQINMLRFVAPFAFFRSLSLSHSLAGLLLTSRTRFLFLWSYRLRVGTRSSAFGQEIVANSSSFAEYVCVWVQTRGGGKRRTFGVFECNSGNKKRKKLKNLCEKGQFIDKSRNMASEKNWIDDDDDDDEDDNNNDKKSYSHCDGNKNRQPSKRVWYR